MKDKKEKLTVIKCPYCGWEYLPAEIFVPKGFFGKPKYVERTPRGRIIDYSGTTLDPIEYYTCDLCNTKFRIKADIRFNTSINHRTNFNEDFSLKSKKNNLFLSED